MKKIIDSSYFRDPALLDYLKSDKTNLVVFSDDACMETYKGNALKNISRSIEIVSNFPNQVVILKSTRDVIRLTLSNKRLELLEDVIQGRKFKMFCLGVERAVRGDVSINKQILRNAQIASNHFDKIRNDAMFVVKGIKGYAKSFKPGHLKVLRNKAELKPEVIEKITKDILLLTAFLFRNNPYISQIPQAHQLRNSYIFRYAISAYLLMLRWITDGGIESAPLSRLQNDCVDMKYVAYATFFDGLLTQDNKMEEIYEDASFILEHLFK